MLVTETFKQLIYRGTYKPTQVFCKNKYAQEFPTKTEIPAFGVVYPLVYF